MACDPEALKHVPLFALLDEEETAVLAGQVELKNFAPHQRIYKTADTDGHAYVMVSGKVRAGYPARRDFPSDLFRSVGVNRRNSTSCFEDRKQRERRQLPKDPVYGWTPNKKPR